MSPGALRHQPRDDGSDRQCQRLMMRAGRHHRHGDWMLHSRLYIDGWATNVTHNIWSTMGPPRPRPSCEAPSLGCCGTAKDGVWVTAGRPPPRPRRNPEHRCGPARVLTVGRRLAAPTSVAHGALRLSDPALEFGIAKLKEKLRSDLAFALKTPQSAGIATATGKLTKRFKGGARWLCCMRDLYKVQPGFVLGFHDCGESVAGRVLSGASKQHLRRSPNRHDWLDIGIYFWASRPQRAMKGAKFVRDNCSVSGGKVDTPAVMGAIIDLSYCGTLHAARCTLVPFCANCATERRLDQCPQRGALHDVLNEMTSRQMWALTMSHPAPQRRTGTAIKVSLDADCSADNAIT